MTQRVSKEDLYAIMALWMERCPLSGSKASPEQQTAETEPSFGVEKAGAVFVDRYGRIVALDCTRIPDDGSTSVHAAARVLVKLPDMVKGCTVYMSRKPCSNCVKLLAQAEVSRICFLPFPPEASPDQNNCDDLENAKRTENLVRICRFSLSVYVPKVDSSNTESHFPITGPEYWSERWSEKLKEMEPRGSDNDIMRCAGVPDSSVVSTMGDSMKRLGRWIDSVTSQLKSDTKFKPFGSNNENASEDELFLHMSRMSLIAAQQSDDPHQGVGVIILKNGEVLSVGTSGYLSEAMFGDFPRFNKPRNQEAPSSDQKWPFLVHAEQNALMLMNTREVADENTVAFVTRPPCNACTSLFKEAGVTSIVLPEYFEPKMSNDSFRQLIQNGEFRGSFGI